MPTAEEFVQKCLAEIGDRYEYGAEVRPGQSADAWDCSELIEVKLRELGIPAPDGSAAQDDWCRRSGTHIPLAQGKATRGALLFMKGHVGVSLGGGETVEASGSKGVARLRVTYQRWTHAGLVPGLDYGARSPAPRPVSERPALSAGSRGEQVRELQQELARLGFDPGPIDGIFGRLTEQAVRGFQQQRALPPTGLVDERTWTALDRVAPAGR